MKKTAKPMSVILAVALIMSIFIIKPEHVSAADTSIVPADCRVAWNPGIPGGVPPVTTIFAVIDPAIYGNGTVDATAAINNAIQAAGNIATPQNRQVVYLPEGVYLVNGSINLNRSNVVLRGAGIRKTYLRGNNSGTLVNMGETNPKYNTTQAIDVIGDVPKGATSITVADASGIQPGDILKLDMNEDGDPMGTYGTVHRFDGDVLMRAPYSYFAPDPESWQWFRGPNSDGMRPVAQFVEVASKNGNTLYLANTVNIDFQSANHPQVWNTRASQHKYIGLEDMTLQNGSGYMVHMSTATSYSWVKNVESDGRYGGWTGIHIAVGGFRNVVRDSYVHYSQNINPGGGAYGISIQGTDCLIENNIVRELNKPIVGLVSGGGNVIAYNYVDGAKIASTPSWQESGLDSNHTCYSHSDLYEGNYAPNFATGATHGNAGKMTIFRNYFTGLNSDGVATGPVRAIEVNGRCREHASIGNVLLSPALGAGAVLFSIPSAPNLDKNAVYRLGNGTWDSQGNMSYGVWDNGQAYNMFHRHLDFDNATGTVYDNPSNPVKTLPDSLYLTQKPAFFGSLPWPWVNPFGATQAERVLTLPAKVRYETEFASSDPVDLTEGGTASDNGAFNYAGEDETKAFDNDIYTKWCAINISSGIIQYDFAGSTAHAVNRYVITSANDFPSRDPRNWTFQGSNDGINWVTLDTRSNITFPSRYMSRTFTFTNTVPYQMYRLNITANNGDAHLQLAELQMYADGGSTPTPVPTPAPTPTPTPTATPAPEQDLTEGGTAYDYGAPNYSYEDETKAFDNNVNTKWLVYNTSTGIIQYDFAGTTAHAVNKYTVTSANDAPGRDPRNWTFQGSNDGSTWITLDTRTNVTFTSRFQTLTFTFSNSTAYQMYRLNITATNGDNNLQIAEIQMFASGTSPTPAPTPTPTPTATPAPGQDLTEGGTAYDYGAPNYSYEDETKAFDNNVNTKWLVYNTSTGILQYDFAGTTAHVVTRYTVTSANDAPGRDPRNWTFQGSNDGSTWTTLDTRTNVTFTSRFQTLTFTFPNSTAYQMYRLNITATNGDNNLQLAELQMFSD